MQGDGDAATTEYHKQSSLIKQKSSPVGSGSGILSGNNINTHIGGEVQTQAKFKLLAARVNGDLGNSK